TTWLAAARHACQQEHAARAIEKPCDRYEDVRAYSVDDAEGQQYCAYIGGVQPWGPCLAAVECEPGDPESCPSPSSAGAKRRDGAQSRSSRRRRIVVAVARRSQFRYSEAMSSSEQGDGRGRWVGVVGLVAGWLACACGSTPAAPTMDGSESTGGT